MKPILAVILCAVAFSAQAKQTLKQGVFTCDASKTYDSVLLNVKQHPTKQNKIILNWTGKDRILHQVPTTTGALRYEGAISQLTYIQTPHHSLVLDSNKMTTVLTECIFK